MNLRLFPFLRYLILIWCCASSTLVYCQKDVYHEIFTAREGLGIDFIEDLVQDNAGYLWISGENLDNRDIIGKSDLVTLQRFDGSNFHNIQLKHDNTSIAVSKMIRFQDQSILLHSKNILKPSINFSFNPFNNTLELKESWGLSAPSNVRYINKSYYVLNTKDLTTVDVHEIKDNKVGKVLFSFENKVNIVDLDRNTTFVQIGDIFLFSDNNFPLTITDAKGGIIKKYSYDGFNRSRDLLAEKLWIEEAFVFNEQLYAFMNNDDRLYEFDRQSLEFKALDSELFEGKQGLKTYVDPNGKVMIAFEKEDYLFLANFRGQEQIDVIYKHPIKNAAAIQMWSMDLNKELWIGVQGELHYYKFPNEQFEKFLIDKQLRAIQAIDSVNYMVATETSGWFKYNHNTKKVTPFPIYEKDAPVYLTSSRNIILDQDTLWTNTFGNIVAVHKENGGSQSYRYYPVQCLEELHDSTLIYGTGYHGLMQFNKNSKTHQQLVRTDTLDLIDLAMDKDKKWIVGATQNGVFTYHLKTKKSKLHSELLKEDYFLMSDYHQEYGFLLGTRDGKVIQFSPENETANVIYQDNLDAGIATITPYRKNLWINTFNGLVQYDIESKTSKRFSSKDGLVHNEGNRYSASRTQDGILIGNLKGLHHFVPEELNALQSKDSLRLLKIRKYDEKLDRFVELYDQSAFAKAEPILLPRENKQLELDFSLTGLDVLRNEYYEYQLNGGEWTNLGEQKKIKFLNLAAGNYDLNIRAKNFSGRIMGKPLNLKIISKEFFYKTWWFISIVLLLIVLVIGWFLYQERIKSLMQVKYSRDLLQNQEIERLRIAKELHDSVGQQLTLIKQTAQNNKLDYISDLTHTTLEEVRSISRNLYPANLYRLGFKASVEQLLEDVDNQTPMFVDLEMEEVDDYLDDKQTLNLYRFIQEATSNVMKHAHSKSLQVVISLKKSRLELKIVDKGKGFNDANELMKNSLGLKTLSERINIINGQLEIKSSPGKGTELIATIPLKNDAIS